MRYRVRKDRLVSEDNIRYIAYGIDVYDGLRKVRNIKDVSLDKKRLKGFVKQCNHDKIKLQHLDNAVQQFVEDEYTVSKKPCFPG